jgi:hypothetical protein
MLGDACGFSKDGRRYKASSHIPQTEAAATVIPVVPGAAATAEDLISGAWAIACAGSYFTMTFTLPSAAVAAW